MLTVLRPASVTPTNEPIPNNARTAGTHGLEFHAFARGLFFQDNLFWLQVRPCPGGQLDRVEAFGLVHEELLHVGVMLGWEFVDRGAHNLHVVAADGLGGECSCRHR
ncbi:hypothetical protein EV193_106131 [Herbihabitans rhizosphaerae]|uniref:Uncharacterized protein n=1 Tax=Herbihabitans rhizosphaerae TaxID=1872711 RepID=A0A4Q7KKZ5_9PSEU|nr:hypothetical protein [Herbihabitans rhizosphaerae]RZS36897.1 hypothetical protein EV193_106131 [Herbihabitans rhizosphaerae]